MERSLLLEEGSRRGPSRRGGEGYWAGAIARAGVEDKARARDGDDGSCVNGSDDDNGARRTLCSSRGGMAAVMCCVARGVKQLSTEIET